MVRLGFHRRLIGGIASRPNFAQKEQVMQNIKNYAALPGQHPLNVRLPIQPDFSNPLLAIPLPEEISFGKRHNLYQRVKRCIRDHKALDTICLDQ